MSNDRTRTEDSPSASHAVTPPPRRRWWLRLVLTLVIFVSGALVGTGGTVLVIRNRVLSGIHHPEQMPQRMVNRLRWPLGLSEEQAVELEQVFERRQASLQQLRRRFQPELEAELDQIEVEVADVLDEEQQKRWQEYFGHIRRTWMPPMPNDPPAGTPKQPAKNDKQARDL
jgi:hypothetical protein